MVSGESRDHVIARVSQTHKVWKETKNKKRGNKVVVMVIVPTWYLKSKKVGRWRSGGDSLEDYQITQDIQARCDHGATHNDFGLNANGVEGALFSR
jgi:hypothetical protein